LQKSSNHQNLLHCLQLSNGIKKQFARTRQTALKNIYLSFGEGRGHDVNWLLPPYARRGAEGKRALGIGESYEL
jgi:hypothetical protein